MWGYYIDIFCFPMFHIKYCHYYFFLQKVM